MKTKHLFIVAWLATIVAALILGIKLSPDDSSQSQEGSTAQQTQNGSSRQRPASRQRPTSSGRATGTNRNSGTSRDRASTAVTSDISEIALVMSDYNPVTRCKSLIELINRLGEDDFEKTADDFLKLTTFDSMHLHDSEFAMLYHAWAKSDPLAALKYTEENKNSPSIARETILASWAAESPQAAQDWIDKHPK